MRKAEQILSPPKASQVIQRIQLGLKGKGVLCALKVPQVGGLNGKKCMEEFLQKHLKKNMIQNAWLAFKVDFMKPKTYASTMCNTKRWSSMMSEKKFECNCTQLRSRFTIHKWEAARI